MNVGNRYGGQVLKGGKKDGTDSLPYRLFYARPHFVVSKCALTGKKASLV